MKKYVIHASQLMGECQHLKNIFSYRLNLKLYGGFRKHNRTACKMANQYFRTSRAGASKSGLKTWPILQRLHLVTFGQHLDLPQHWNQRHYGHDTRWLNISHITPIMALVSHLKRLTQTLVKPLSVEMGTRLTSCNLDWQTWLRAHSLWSLMKF